MDAFGTAGLSDEALLSGLAIGEPDATLQFVRRFQGQVYGLALRILSDPMAAEDAAQEAFVRAWRHAEGFDSRRGTVAAWLMRITRNLAIDALRLRRPESIDPFLVPRWGPVSEADAVEDVVVKVEATARVRRALRSLPGDQARALLLAAYYGYTATEIAALEEIPLGTAKTRIRLGLARVRAALRESSEVYER